MYSEVLKTNVKFHKVRKRSPLELMISFSRKCKSYLEVHIKELTLKEKISNCGKPLQTYEEAFEHSMTFLSNPWKIWESGDTNLRRIVLTCQLEGQPTICDQRQWLTFRIVHRVKLLKPIGLRAHFLRQVGDLDCLDVDNPVFIGGDFNCILHDVTLS